MMWIWRTSYETLNPQKGKNKSTDSGVIPINSLLLQASLWVPNSSKPVDVFFIFRGLWKRIVCLW